MRAKHDKPDSYVYLYFRLDGRPLYLGKGRGDRWKAHQRRKSSNRHLAAVVAGARQQGKELPVVILHDSLTPTQAVEYEIALIAAIGREAHGGPLVNLTDGGEGVVGYVWTEEDRAKISNGLKAISPEARERREAARLAAMRTPEHREKISRLTKGRRLTPEQRIARSERQRGRKMSPQAVEKTAAAHRGAKRSEETRRRQSESRKAWFAKNGGYKREPLSQERKAHLSEKLKAYYAAKRREFASVVTNG